MKKIVFAVDKNSFNNPDHAGVNQKVASQLEQMRKGGNEAILLQYIWKDGELQISVTEDTDVLYFRRIESSVKLIKALKKCKDASPNLRIVMEIPTFPFSGEQNRKSFKQKVNEIIGNFLLKRYIDRIVICGEKLPMKKFHGIPIIYFSNGIDFDKIPCNVYKGKSDEIHMVCVSGCMLSHGYDRMIRGIDDYYKCNPKRKVFFHIVGTGEHYCEYENIAKECGLYEKYVFFYGRKTGSELDEIYAQSNLAVAHLAAHRVGLKVMSSLKSREYAARGIPFVSSTEFDFSNDATNRYICYVEANEANIDVDKVIDFFDNVYGEENVSAKMRDTFKDICSWNTTFVDVLDYINS